MDFWVKPHYDDPLLGFFGFSIVVSLVEILSFATSHYAITCNQVSFAIKFIVFPITKLVLYNFWVIRLCVQLPYN